MKIIKLLVLVLGLCITAGTLAQVPVPQTVNGSSTSGISWTKTDDINYEITENGRKLTNVMDMVYLRTDTLTVMDRNTRTIYMLADFKNASVGSRGQVVTLAQNIGKDFYVTNPYSFVFYNNDVNKSNNPFTNVEGSYLYYLEENNTTYLFPGIRSFSNWGAKTAQKLPFSEGNAYWCKTPGDSYHLIINGRPANYDNITTRKSGNDVIIIENGVDTYSMTGFYTKGTYDFAPATKISNNTPVNISKNGCVSGNCQDGWGKTNYEGGYYEGFWKNGKKEGYGLYKWDAIGKYIGNWVNDTMEGYGVYIADNNDNIIGEYKNGQLNGLGITVSGDVWEQGLFTNGNLTTPYDFYTTNADKGCTAGDCQNKYGRFKWDNGDSFTGFFRNGKMYLGTYSFASGDKYSGMFNNNNQFQGTGRFFFADNAYYGGNWVNGQYQGRGYFHNKDLQPKIGEWNNGTLVKSLK